MLGLWLYSSLQERLSICVGKREGVGAVDQVPAPLRTAPMMGEVNEPQSGTTGVYLVGKVGGGMGRGADTPFN